MLVASLRSGSTRALSHRFAMHSSGGLCVVPSSRPLLRLQAAGTCSKDLGRLDGFGEILLDSTPIASSSNSACSGGAVRADRRGDEAKQHHHLPSVQVATVGRIELIFGPMFAGKTTELLSRVRSEQSAGKTVALVKSSIDTRYKCDQVTTHNGDEMACTAVDTLMPILDDATLMSKDVIAVDEAQFFHDLVEFVLSASEKHNKTVLVAGLDGDFKR